MPLLIDALVAADVVQLSMAELPAAMLDGLAVSEAVTLGGLAVTTDVRFPARS
jgi:hypothetical protein